MSYDKEEFYLSIFFIGFACLIITSLMNIASHRDDELLNWRSGKHSVHNKP